MIFEWQGDNLMLREELKYLKRHKFMVVVLIVLMFIPAIYACTFLASMWNPYGKLNDLPVAIVNNDQPAKMNGKTINIGKELTQNLVKSDSLDFKNVTKKKAQSGLKAGKYFAIYTVPQTFSKNSTTVLSKHPQSMKLKLETSSGNNMTAGKMTESAGNAIQTKLDGQVSSTYAKVLVSSITKLEGGIKQASVGSKKIASGQNQVNTGTQTFNSSLQKLVSGNDQLKSGSQAFGAGLTSYVGAVGKVQSGSSQLASGMSKVNEAAPALGSGISQLQSGSSQLAGGLDETTSGMTKLQAGASTLTEKLAEYQNSSATIATKSTEFSDNLSEFSNELKTQINTSSTETAQFTQLAALISSIQTTLKSIQTNQTNTASGVSSALANEATELNLTAEQSKKNASCCNSTG